MKALKTPRGRHNSAAFEGHDSCMEKEAMMSYFVEVVENKTSAIVKRMGPMSEWKADRVENGVLINLNWKEFSTRVVSQ